MIIVRENSEVAIIYPYVYIYNSNKCWVYGRYIELVFMGENINQYNPKHIN